MTNTNNRRTNKHTKTVIPFIRDAEFYFSKGVEAFYKQKFEIAIKWIKKAIEEKPEEALYPAQISIIYTEMGSYHLANQILTELEEKHGDEYSDCYYLMANNYAHLGLFNDAQKCVSIYLEKDPNGEFRSEAVQLLTVLEMSLSDDEEDIELLEEDELLIYQETAFYHLQRHEWQHACKILSEMIDRFPEHRIIQHQYHYALFFFGERKKAIELEEKLSHEEDFSIYSITNLIIFYYDLGKLEKMELLIKKLKNIYPMHFEQALKIAISYAYVKRYEQAYQRFRQLPKEKLTNHLDYFRYFAKTAYALTYYQQAQRIWTKACKMHEELVAEPLPWFEDEDE